MKILSAPTLSRCLHWGEGQDYVGKQASQAWAGGQG